jgi:hypothetical protein
MQKFWQVGATVDAMPDEKVPAGFGCASLREDYLNQVQRDFLSRAICTAQHP